MSISVTSIKRWIELIISLGLFVLFVAGCASLQEIRAKESLRRASDAYARAKADPNVEAYAPAPLTEAGRMIQEARQTTSFKEMEQLGYVAEKKVQTALSIAEGKVVQKEIETLRKEEADVLMQKRLLEVKLAKMEAEAKAREAEQARLAAKGEAATAEKAKREAEQSRSLALAEAERAERLKREAEAKAREAEEARLRARMEAATAEQARLAAKGEAATAEKAKREAERSRLSALAEAEKAERSKSEAEARAREAEQARLRAMVEAERAEKTKAETDQLLKEFAELNAQQTERGLVLTMGDVLFAFGESMLLPGAIRNVEKVADFLGKNPTRDVLIEGFTDSIGSDDFNLRLSKKRADSVKEQLVAEGINPGRITTKGYGKEFPVASNNSEGGRQLNRRVEVLILNEGVEPETMFRK